MIHKEFAKLLDLRMTPVSIPDRPDSLEWVKGARHWLACMSIPSTGKRFQVYYSQGPAHKNPPQAHEVLYCLQANCIGVENGQTFEEWANEYGYDEDSRKAERTYNACVDTAKRLKEFLGFHWETFLELTED